MFEWVYLCVYQYQVTQESHLYDSEFTTDIFLATNSFSLS